MVSFKYRLKKQHHKIFCYFVFYLFFVISMILDFPDNVSTIQKNRVLGNSLNVHVVSVLIRLLTMKWSVHTYESPFIWLLKRFKSSPHISRVYNTSDLVLSQTFVYYLPWCLNWLCLPLNPAVIKLIKLLLLTLLVFLFFVFACKKVLHI